MITFKCKNCGGEMSVSSDGSMYCEYCGSKYFFTDKDLTGYRAFRLQMLNYLREVKDEKSLDVHNEAYLWQNAENAVFTADNGDVISVNYLYSSVIDGITVYMSKSAVIYHFPDKYDARSDAFIRNVSRLQFPPADVKNLKSCCPCISGKFVLDGGGTLILCERADNFFPLSMLGALSPEHTAWVISRLENICCLLAYNDITHNNITIDSVYVNPFTHQATLFGAWWNVGPISDLDLRAVRTVGSKILGIYVNSVPVLMKEFLNSAPFGDAFSDFAEWDRVIMHPDGFNGRKFTKFKNNI